MSVLRKNAIRSILLVCGTVLFIFFIRLKYKSTASYSQDIAQTNKDKHYPATSDEIREIENYPSIAEACISRAALHYSKGQYGQAILDYTKALEINPKNALIFYKRGNAYKAKGQNDQAISDYTKALAIKKTIC